MRSLSLADFTAPTDLPNDLPAAMRRFLPAAPEGDFRLELGGRTWRLYPEAALETEVFPSNNDAGRVKTGLWLRDKVNVEVAGDGARLIVSGFPDGYAGAMGTEAAPLLPVLVERCRGLTLRDFAIDWEVPRTTEGVVIESRPGWLDVRLPREPAWFVWAESLFFRLPGATCRVGMLLAVDPATGAIAPGTGDNLGAGYSAPWSYEALDEERVRIRGPLARGLDPGTVILFWKTHLGPSDRRQPAIFVDGSEDVTLEGLALHHAVGMGVIAQRTRNVSLRRCVVEPSAGRHFSLTADGAHFVSCRGEVRIEQCRFQNQFDDAINVHSLYGVSLRAVEPDRVRVRTAHPQHQYVNHYAAGDRLAWIDPASFEVRATATLRAAAALNGEVTELELDAPIPESHAAGCLVENLDAHPDVTLRGNVIRWNRARGALLNGKGRIRVEENHFETAGAAIEFESSASWGESGCFRDVEIRGNTFDGCRYIPAWGHAVVQVWPHLKADPAAPIFGRLRVERNTFRNAHPPLLAARCVEHVAFLDNEEDGAPAAPDRVECEHCAHVEITPS